MIDLTAGNRTAATGSPFMPSGEDACTRVKERSRAEISRRTEAVTVIVTALARPPCRTGRTWEDVMLSMMALPWICCRPMRVPIAEGTADRAYMRQSGDCAHRHFLSLRAERSNPHRIMHCDGDSSSPWGRSAPNIKPRSLSAPIVMAGLVPGLVPAIGRDHKTLWMTGTGPAMTAWQGFIQGGSKPV